MQPSDVIYDWNTQGHAISPPMRRAEVHDETLRDGIQSPSVYDPNIDEKMRILRLLDKVGVDSTNVGLPGAGRRAVEDSKRLVEMIRDEGLGIRPGCAARTHPNDIRPIIEIAEQTGVPIEIMAFLGSSPIRMYAEKWDEDRLEKLTRDAVRMGVEAGMPVSFVTEDTVRSKPQTLKRLFEAAVEEGATRLVLCDTVGHSTTNGVFNLVHFTHNLLIGMGVRDQVKLDWHGHNDRGHGLTNALYAIEAGIDRVHGCVLGIGERVGNTPIDLLLVNLKLLGAEERELTDLTELVNEVAKACRWDIPVNYPVFGRDAFRTGTGVHAAAVIKAEANGDDWLADAVYSGVPASWVGRYQEIEIGHQSGLSNIKYWLRKRNIADDDARIANAIFDYAKTKSELLTDEEVLSIVAKASS
ncbi:MAG: 2-isopropylmalate synthase [Proteobacteria bacterium]|nr:2-isopropylmalate synthase [Pseudomonadota bacterium]